MYECVVCCIAYDSKEKHLQTKVGAFFVSCGTANFILRGTLIFTTWDSYYYCVGRSFLTMGQTNLSFYPNNSLSNQHALSSKKQHREARYHKNQTLAIYYRMYQHNKH